VSVRKDRRWKEKGLNRREQEVETLLAPTVESLGCSVWGVEYLSQGKHSKLRLYIDREGGVDVDACAEVSRHVSDILDVEDFSGSAYILEVSSPGFDRVLFTEDQFAGAVGEQIDVRLNFPFEGRKKFAGTLAGVEDKSVVVQVEDDEFVLPLENIQKARIVPVFE
jgi:ribosome maturation factor RimP